MNHICRYISVKKAKRVESLMSKVKGQKSKVAGACQTRNSKQNPKLGTRNPELETRNSELNPHFTFFHPLLKFSIPKAFGTNSQIFKLIPELETRNLKIKTLTPPPSGTPLKKGEIIGMRNLVQ